MVELPDHPHFIGCQFHPEFKSKPLEPHPLFSTFVAGGVRIPFEAARRERDGRGRDVPPSRKSWAKIAGSNNWITTEPQSHRVTEKIVRISL